MPAPEVYPRLVPRFPVQLRVDWWLDGSSLHYVSQTADLSRRGVFIGALAPGDVGARVRMRIPARGEELELAGTIVHRDDRGMGISFEGTAGRPRRLLGEMIAGARNAA